MKKGDLVKVIKRGLMSTGWIGTVQWAGGDKVEVVFPERNRPLTFNVASLEQQVDKPKEPAPKPEVKRKRIIDKVTTVMIPERDEMVLVRRGQDGKLVTVRTRFRGMEGDLIVCGNGQKVDVKDVIYLFPLRNQYTFVKPEVNAMPFWIWEDERQVGIRDVVERDYGKVFIIEGGMEFHVDWLKEGQNLRLIETQEVERFEIEGEGLALFNGMFDEVCNKLAASNRKANGRNMSFAVTYLDNKGHVKVWEELGAACHYSMKTFAHDINQKQANVKWLAAVQFLGKRYEDGDKDTKALIQRWTEWVMNDSPWSQYIITKDFNEVVTSGVKVRLDIPSNALLCTMYALRYPTEYMDNRVKVWDEVVQQGLNPTMAYFYAETERFARDTSGHHQLLDTFSMDKQRLVNFIQHKVGGVVEKDWTETHRYANVSIHHGDKERPAQTAIAWLKKQDIFTGEEINVGGAFQQRLVKQVDLAKLQELVLKLKGE